MGQRNLSRTYKEVAEDFIKDADTTSERNPDVYIGFKEGVEQFAKYLDGFRTLDSKLELLAMQKSREIDGEVLLLLAKELPKEKVEEIVKSVMAKHRHTTTKL